MVALTPELTAVIARERRRWWLNRLLVRGLVELGLVVFALAGAGVVTVLAHNPVARAAFVDAARADVAHLVGR